MRRSLVLRRWLCRLRGRLHVRWWRLLLPALLRLLRGTACGGCDRCGRACCDGGCAPSAPASAAPAAAAPAGLRLRDELCLCPAAAHRLCIPRRLPRRLPAGLLRGRCGASAGGGCAACFGCGGWFSGEFSGSGAAVAGGGPRPGGAVPKRLPAVRRLRLRLLLLRVPPLRRLARARSTSPVPRKLLQRLSLWLLLLPRRLWLRSRPMLLRLLW